MRISDWSSDVCSSDLGIDLFQRQAFDRSVEDVERRGGFGEDLPVIHRINELAGERDRIARGGGYHGILLTRPQRGDPAVELVLGEDRMGTRLNSSHYCASRMPSLACTKLQ